MRTYDHTLSIETITEIGWHDGFHINKGDEAKGLCDLLNNLERERDEARAEMIRWMSIAEGRGHTDETLSNQ